MIPLADASRRPRRFPVVTTAIIFANVFVFVLELTGGDPFVDQWLVIPADIVAGHHWLTVVTAMFMHASWMHIIGNMMFLWAFGPEVEDAMRRPRYLALYLWIWMRRYLLSREATSVKPSPVLRQLPTQEGATARCGARLVAQKTQKPVLSPKGFSARRDGPVLPRVGMNARDRRSSRPSPLTRTPFRPCHLGKRKSEFRAQRNWKYRRCRSAASNKILASKIVCRDDLPKIPLVNRPIIMPGKAFKSLE